MGGVSPPFVAVEHIRRRSDAGSYARGLDYFQTGAVRSLTWDPGEAVLRSIVDGSASHRYRCVIRLDPRRLDRPIVSASCTCPVQSNCKHAVATLLESNRRAQQEAAATSGSWRALLAAPRSGLDSDEARARRRAAPARQALSIRMVAACEPRPPPRGDSRSPVTGCWWDFVRSSAAPAPRRGSRAMRRGTPSAGRATGTTRPRRAGSSSCTASAAT